MTSLMRRIENAEQKNEVITPDSSDVDNDSPRKFTTVFNESEVSDALENIVIDISNNST